MSSKTSRYSGIQFKFTKCKFAHEVLDLLGFRVGHGKRMVDLKKADALKRWPDPQSTDDIVSFHAFANYLKEFIPGFVDIAQPLKAYRKKGAKWEDSLQDKKA